VNHVDTLRLSWNAVRQFFTRDDSEVFLGTQLVLLSRQLEVVAESVQEAYSAMDSVFLGAAERQTTLLDFQGRDARLTVAGLLEWVDRFVSEEGPRLLQDAGKDGAIAFRSTIDELQSLVNEAFRTSKQNSGNPTRGFHSPRVQRALEELTLHLTEASVLARQISRTPRPVILSGSIISLKNEDNQNLTLGGKNFKTGIEVRLTRGSDVIKAKMVDVDDVSNNELTATFDLRSAELVAWTVDVTNPDGGYDRGEENGITVASSPPPPPPVGAARASAPVLKAIMPNNGGQGQTLEVDVYGKEFRNGVTIDLGQEIQVDRPTWDDDANFKVKLTIMADAQPGRRQISIISPEGIRYPTNVYFTVVAKPRVTSVDPPSGARGNQVDVTIEGSGFQQPADIEFGEGIRVARASGGTDKQLHVTVYIDDQTATGPRKVTIINADQQRGEFDSFTVTD
jgi:hypothetical protein